ncbi:hypothetical protein SAMN05421770_10126 [Granulicella rosea]|uniref:Uncharacterized protein n=1 Tax=Granulicella rosea TaxID=474952 RepID=A0A239CNG8_9BACT|nr:hypothetical protein [Granulicella rosea]SNS21705.1 hypothetical protein SAMN05421770_10126 [Granulicella rosea]
MSLSQPLEELHQAQSAHSVHAFHTPAVLDAESLGRPLGVTVVAGFQFFKAGILLLAGLLLRVAPDYVSSPRSLLYPLLFIATRGKFTAMHDAAPDSGLLPALLTFLGVYLAVIGFGMWRVRLWARKSTLLNAGLTLLLFAQTQLSAPPPTSAAAASPDLNFFHAVLAVDALIFLYLVRGNTLEFFEAVDWRRKHS